MRKHLSAAVACLFTALLCVGCSNGQTASPPSDTSTNTPILYSNLTDPSAQKEVADLLAEHGVTKEQTDTLLSWADDFNGRVTSSPLPEGFLPLKDTKTAYSGLTIKSKEADDGSLYPEANCRLASYLLIKNLLHTNGTHIDNDTVLMFDVEAIDTYAPFSLKEEERDPFLSLFSWVPLDGADTVEAHLERIQNTWKERALSIKGNGISLITVYLHLPFDDVRFVGHTGVLLDTEGALLFVEKYGPQLPFQATKFHNRDELKQYLLARTDLYGDETELPPIVLENDQPLP